MAVLGNRAFKEALDAGKLVIEPRPPDEHIGTSAIDLTLAGEFKRWKQPRPGMEFTIDPAADGFSFQAIASDHHEPFPADEDGSVVLRPGKFLLGRTAERVHLPLGDWRSLLARLADVEARMCAVLDELGLTALAASIDGLSAVGAAAILAETGDLSRFASGRSVVKHAGLNPAENTSATLAGATRISRRGRPGLRTAAWRAAWPGVRHNRVLRARYAHLTGRDGNRLSDGQARAACAATLLRWLWAVVTRR